LSFIIIIIIIGFCVLLIPTPHNGKRASDNDISQSVCLFVWHRHRHLTRIP